MLTKDREQELATIIQTTGDDAAKKAAVDELVLNNLALVVSIARAFGIGHVDELVAAGNLGLVIAAQQYEPGTTANFGTYARTWILQSMQRNAAIGTFNRSKMRRHGVELKTTGQEPDRSDRNSRADGPGSVADIPDYRENGETSDAKQDVAALMECLNDRERLVVTKRFGLDGSDVKILEDIGQELGLTKERVRQIMLSAGRKLRQAAETRALVA